MRGFSVFLVFLLVLLFPTSLGLVFHPRRVRIGVDFGPRLIGLAYSDVFAKARPVRTISMRPDVLQVCNAVLDLAREKSASEIVVGLPFDRAGLASEENVSAQLSLNFSRVLSALSLHQCAPPVAVSLFDERYTTKEARLRRRRGEVFGSVDAVSAACLLERFVEDEGRGALPAEPCAFPPPPELAVFDYEVVRRHVQGMYPHRPRPRERQTERQRERGMTSNMKSSSLTQRREKRPWSSPQRAKQRDKPKDEHRREPYDVNALIAQHY